MMVTSHPRHGRQQPHQHRCDRLLLTTQGHGGSVAVALASPSPAGVNCSPAYIPPKKNQGKMSLTYGPVLNKKHLYSGKERPGFSSYMSEITYDYMSKIISKKKDFTKHMDVKQLPSLEKSGQIIIFHQP